MCCSSWGFRVQPGGGLLLSGVELVTAWGDVCCIRALASAPRAARAARRLALRPACRPSVEIAVVACLVCMRGCTAICDFVSCVCPPLVVQTKV